MKTKLRSLNKHECYACSVKDVKKVFTHEDGLFISFGILNRKHSFDSEFINRPHIEGLIISSLQINRRTNVLYSTPILSFYVIKNDMYNDKHRDIFCESILPKMNNWYHETLLKPDSSIPGVEVLLVESKY